MTKEDLKAEVKLAEMNICEVSIIMGNYDDMPMPYFVNVFLYPNKAAKVFCPFAFNYSHN